MVPPPVDALQESAMDDEPPTAVKEVGELGTANGVAESSAVASVGPPGFNADTIK